MTAAELIAYAQNQGVTLRLAGDKIKATGNLDGKDGLLQTLRSHKSELVQWFAQADITTSSAAHVSVDWRVLAKEYQHHHVKCPICIAAGRGSQYGLRCGVGMALWRDYAACDVAREAK